MTAAYEDIASPKSFVHQRWEKSWLVCQCEEGDLNDVYTVAVKTDVTKTVQIKRNNDLSSCQLHFIIDFVLTELNCQSTICQNIFPPKFPAIRYLKILQGGETSQET